MTKEIEIENIEKDENIVVTDDVTEETEKVHKKERKTTPKKKSKIKKVAVLVYAKNEKFIIVKFDEKRNLRIDGIEENPGKQIMIEYDGTPGTSDFKVSVKK